MNIIELYEQTPVEMHKDIKVAGDKVYIRDADGDVTKYLILEDGELWLTRSDKKLKSDVEAIKKKLAA
ncbi:unnamed protein product [marine sediment metagenome]|uniref:Uncharacterized protein n=1 Tax=marine sediment metagenome TaxID=412755 RepID=X1VWX8_9ZZZZ